MAISDAKTTQLETYIRERRGDLTVLGRSPSIVDAIAELERAPPERAARFAGAIRGGAAVPPGPRELRRDRSATPTPTCSTPTATLLFRLKADLDLGPNLLTGPLKDSELAEVFDRVRTLLQVELSDYQVYPGRSEPAAFIAGPVYNAEGRIVGYRGPGAGQPRGLPDLHATTTGWARPARRWSAMRDGDELTFVAPPRHDAGRGLPAPGADRQRQGRSPCSGPCRASAATARRSTIAASRSIAVWSYLPSYPLGHGGQAGRRRGVRADLPPAAGDRRAPGARRSWS